MEGKVIGIHSRIGPLIIANIHVPVDSYRETWDRLAKGDSWGGWFGDSTLRGGDAFLGVVLNGDIELEIGEFSPQSPAEKAGLKIGDVIVAIDGKKITKRSELSSYLKKKKPGDEVTIEVEREKKPLSVKVKLGKRPTD
jgi:serine protease Do